MQEHVTLASHLPHGTQARLQNDVPGFAAKRARAIIKEELGASVGRDRVRVRVRVRVPSSRRSWAPRCTRSSNLTLALALALTLTLTLALALALTRPDPNPNQVDDLFADFSDTPLAAASLAQVG